MERNKPEMTFSIPEIHATLNDLESQFGLFDRTVEDVRYWERVRNDIYDDVCNSVGVFGKANVEPGESWSERFRGLYLLLRNAIIRNPYLVTQHNFLFYSHPRRKKQDDETWWDLYTDPILEEVDLDAVSLEYDHGLTHYTPARTSSLRYTDLIEYCSTVYKMLPNYELPQAEAEYLAGVEEAFETAFRVEIDIVKTVREELAERKILVPLYESLLTRVNPKVVVLVVSYGKESFIEACQNMGVPVVELQHGSISKYHCGYSFPSSEKKDTFPDYFLTFGSFWRNRLDLPIDEGNIYDVGYPHLEQKVSEVSIERKPDPNSKRRIAFISQGTIGAELSKFAAELGEVAEDEFSVIYKLHPDEYSTWKNKYPWLVESPVEVHEGESMTLYELFSSVDIQVGVYSTAIYEGLHFDLKTYVLDIEGVHYVQDLVDDGTITTVSSPQDLIDKLDEETTVEYDSERFFKQNAIREFERRLTQIVDKEYTDI